MPQSSDLLNQAMIKLRKNCRNKSQVHFYLVERTHSVSPDYVGLQVTYGYKNKGGRTCFYWFKNKKLPNGKTLDARTQMKRKVRDLVLRRLRNGYVLVRKCDPWCRAAVEQSVTRSRLPKQTRKRVPRQRRPRPWESNQLTFDFH